MYNRWRAHPGLDDWVFDGVCPTTKRAFVRMVPNRTRATLIPIIEERIAQGSRVHSDQWAPYNVLSEMGYDHHTVNHSVEFVAADGTHTQEIESFWNQVKAEIKIRRGYTKAQVGGFLDEIMYRREFRDGDVFESLLEHIAQQYQVNDY